MSTFVFSSLYTTITQHAVVDATAQIISMLPHVLIPTVLPTPNKIHVFRVIRPYLNLLVKTIIFQVSEKNIILCILKGEIFAFNYIVFPGKKYLKEICVPTLHNCF